MKKCPFCGDEDSPELISNMAMKAMFNDDYAPCHEDDYEEVTNGWFVICSAGKTGCGADSGWAETKEDAIIKWNRRA